MGTLTIETFPLPTTRRSARHLDEAWSRAVYELADRTVWCADAVHDLLGCPGVAARPLAADLEGVGPDDVVVLHDAPTLALAEALRERGTHVVWHVHPGRPLPAQRRRTIDAFATSWDRRPARGRAVHRVTALLPAAGIAVTKEWAVELPPDELWGSALADVLHDDRREVVGGTRHARPHVAAR